MQILGSSCQNISSEEDRLNRSPAIPPIVRPAKVCKPVRMKLRLFIGFIFGFISLLYATIGSFFHKERILWRTAFFPLEINGFR
jgi:hypothetical protein